MRFSRNNARRCRKTPTVNKIKRGNVLVCLVVRPVQRSLDQCLPETQLHVRNQAARKKHATIKRLPADTNAWLHSNWWLMTLKVWKTEEKNKRHPFQPCYRAHQSRVTWWMIVVRTEKATRNNQLWTRNKPACDIHVDQHANIFFFPLCTAMTHPSVRVTARWEHPVTVLLGAIALIYVAPRSSLSLLGWKQCPPVFMRVRRSSGS